MMQSDLSRPVEPHYSGAHAYYAERYHAHALMLMPNLRLQNYMTQIASIALYNALALLMLCAPCATVVLWFRVILKAIPGAITRIVIGLGSVIVNALVIAIMNDWRKKCGGISFDRPFFSFWKPVWHKDLPTASALRHSVLDYRAYMAQRQQYLNDKASFEQACAERNASAVAAFETKITDNAKQLLGSDYEPTIERNAIELAKVSGWPLPLCLEEIRWRIVVLLWLELDTGGRPAGAHDAMLRHTGVESVLQWWREVDPRGSALSYAKNHPSAPLNGVPGPLDKLRRQESHAQIHFGFRGYDDIRYYISRDGPLDFRTYRRIYPGGD